MNPLDTFAPVITTGAAIVLTVTILITFFRTLIGPRMSDRVVAVNMMGTQGICLIAVLTLRLQESWLVDIAIIYAMFSFLAVLVLTKMDISVYRQWRYNQRRSRERHRQNRAQAVRRRQKSQNTRPQGRDQT